MYSFTETLQPPSADVMNILDGYQTWYVPPHVYQGDDNGEPTTNYPTYYNYNAAGSYWGSGSAVTQAVLEMTPNSRWAAGAMFWSEYYGGGGVVTITLIGTYSRGSAYPADGYSVYLFLSPTMWGIEPPQYNWSIPYLSSSPPHGVKTYLSTQGDVLLPPQSRSPYLVIQ